MFFFFSLEWKKTGRSGCVPTKRRRFFLSFLETHFPSNIFHQFLYHPGPSCAVGSISGLEGWCQGGCRHIQDGGSHLPLLPLQFLQSQWRRHFASSSWCENSKIAWSEPQISGGSFSALMDILIPHHPSFPSPTLRAGDWYNTFSTWVSCDTRKARYMDTLAVPGGFYQT